jgi:hypothetical protein
VTREHEDLEIAGPASQFGLVRTALADFDIEVVGSGHRWPLDSPAFDVPPVRCKPLAHQVGSVAGRV